jgi:hypothetical protein
MINIDTFEIGLIMDKIINFLQQQKVEEVELKYFSLEVDDEIKELVSVDKLKEKAIDLYERDEGHFYFEVDSNRFEYDGSEFMINSTEFEKEIKNINLS